MATGRITLALLPLILLTGVLVMPSKSFAQSPTCTVPSGSVELFYASVAAATVYTGQTLHITGTVSFNANITMTACTVLMEPNAVLNVAGSIGTSGAVNTFRRNSVAARIENSTLTVNNSTF